LGYEALDGTDGEKKKVLLSGHSFFELRVTPKSQILPDNKTRVMWGEIYPEYAGSGTGRKCGTDVTTGHGS
jgi:hypothetical protein